MFHDEKRSALNYDSSTLRVTLADDARVLAIANAVTHGGNPQDPYGFLSCSTWGDPKTALTHRAASPVRQSTFCILSADS